MNDQSRIGTGAAETKTPPIQRKPKGNTCEYAPCQDCRYWFRNLFGFMDCGREAAQRRRGKR